MTNLPVIPDRLPSLRELMGESWSRYKLKFWPLMAIGSLGAIITITAGFVPFSCALLIWFGFGYSNLWLWALAGLLSISAALWAATWAQVALMQTALDGSGSVEAFTVYRKSWKKISPFSWVCLLAFLSAIGGVYLFVLPGIFLAFALAFSPFVCLAENTGGLKALERSLAYANGRWTGITGRLIFISLATWILSKIPILGILSGIFTIPFALVFTTVLYSKLRQAREPEPFSHGHAFLLASFAGFIIPALLAFRLATLWPQIHAEIQREAGPFLSKHMGSGFQ
jgi:hypothetical protein